MALEPASIKSNFAKWEKSRNWIITVAICGALIACDGPPSPLPPGPNGKVSLRYERIVNDGSNIKHLFFVFENRSLRTIYFRGIETPSSGIYPVYSALDCSVPEPNGETLVHNFPTVDFLHGPPPWIHVRPGQWVHLNLHDGFVEDSVLIEHPGALCEARIELKDDEVVKSEEFHAPSLTKHD